ncbi:MAG: hypothetical protein AAFO69_18785, partial [Bacteroidota bacterium]
MYRTRTNYLITTVLWLLFTVTVVDDSLASRGISTNKAFTGNIIFVDIDASGAADGTSWVDAFNSINAALSTATAGDQVWVAEGTYLADPTGTDAAITFAVRNGVDLYGGFDGTETSLEARDFSANQTILSGDLAGNDTGLPGAANSSYSENTITLFNLSGSGFNQNMRVDGFTISGSKTRFLQMSEADNRLTFSNCVMENNLSDVVMFSVGNSSNVTSATGAELVIENTIIRNNSFGGQMVFNSTFGSSIGTRFIQCLIHNNTLSQETSGTYSSRGIFVNRTSDTFFADNGGNSQMSFTNCTIADNDITDPSASVFATLRTGTRGNSLINTLTVNNTIVYGNGAETNPVQRALGGASANSMISTVFNNVLWEVDPQFTTNGTNNYYLSVCSPALNAGSTNFIDLSTFENDLAGNPRVM